MRYSQFHISRRSTLQLAAASTALCVAGVGLASPAVERLAAGRRGQSFDAGWTFFRGDAVDASAPLFNDTRWRRLDLPHDWSIEDLERQEPSVNAVIRDVDTAPIWAPVKSVPGMIGPFEGAPPPLLIASTRSAGGRHTGHMVGGVGWYRKRFSLAGLPADAHVELVFDGVYGTSEFWLNGEQIGSGVHGYSPIVLDLTPYIRSAGENVLAVRVANLGSNSRWYSGSGIYRAVRLNVTRATRFSRWGVRVTTPEVSPARALVHVRARVEGIKPGMTVAVALRDGDGHVVARAEAPALAETMLTLEIAKPATWSPDSPALYEAECTLHDADGVVDRMVTPFGVRHIEISVERGLLVNGKPTKLRGGCIHHDNGLIGAVAIDRAEERKIELLKARGFNAVRTSHNFPSTSFLDACDRLGMFVIEEAFDSWNIPKIPDDYHIYFQDHWRRDLSAAIERDANHPSVIIWSIGNEIPEKYRPLGVDTARQLVDQIRQIDPTRPITAGINGWNGPAATRNDGTHDQAATQFLDIAGYNYNHAAYEKEHPKYPRRIFMGTESFPKDAASIWRTVNRAPYALGDFVWTAMDYYGESGIGLSALEETDPFQSAYPWVNAFCGDIDLIGQQKPQSLLRDVLWGLSPVEISVVRPLPEGKTPFHSKWGWGDELQSWTWPAQDGKPIDVRVFSSGDRVELTLNGRTVAQQSLTDADNLEARFTLPYAPGKLIASAYRGRKLIGRRVLQTAGPAAALRLDVDRPRIRASRNDLAYVTVSVVDAQGLVLPDEVRVLQAALSGPVELAGFGNANPRGVASLRQPVAKTWHGHALAILRPTGSGPSATIEVRSEGLASAVARLTLFQDIIKA